MSKNPRTGADLIHRQRLADALRELCAEVVACDVPDDVFREALPETEALIAKLKDKPRRRRVVSGSLKEEIRTDGKRYHYGDLIDFSPFSGPANPLAPPMNIYKEDEATLKAFVTFSSAFEGGPGLTHGGCVAAAFDELLGLTQSLTGKAGMTGTLKVRYRNPCPLHTELVMQGNVHKMEGRKIIARGTMHAGDVLVADAEAMFILVDREQFRNKIPERAKAKLEN